MSPQVRAVYSPRWAVTISRLPVSHLNLDVTPLTSTLLLPVEEGTHSFFATGGTCLLQAEHLLR